MCIVIKTFRLIFCSSERMTTDVLRFKFEAEVLIFKNVPGGRYSQKPLEFTNTLVLKVASNLS